MFGDADYGLRPRDQQMRCGKCGERWENHDDDDHEFVEPEEDYDDA